jgi:aspartate/tyrosine/aromatic aminotransferase
MFSTLTLAPPDSILGLTEAFKKDPNPEKINLGVGVYEDEQGHTPVLECVKRAELRLLQEESSKNYLGIAGLAEYDRAVLELLFGRDGAPIASGRAAAVQTPGGTGALRVAADFLSKHFPTARIWFSKPTWANHPQVFAAAGVPCEYYPYLNAAGTGLDFEGMLAGLSTIQSGDVVCLHACCHNPTGIDPTLDQWRRIAAVLADRKLLPLVDFAYQGFGDGLEEDAAGLREICARCPEALICSSFSKNFGLYGERVGALTITAADAAACDAALSQVKICVRSNYSNPPKHGAAIVGLILGDAELRGLWERELAAMRERIRSVREMLVERLAAKGVKGDYSFITRQRGMFSFSRLTQMQVDELRNRHSIYIVGGGRINVAGIRQSNIDRLCEKVADVLGEG